MKDKIKKFKNMSEGSSSLPIFQFPSPMPLRKRSSKNGKSLKSNAMSPMSFIATLSPIHTTPDSAQRARGADGLEYNLPFKLYVLSHYVFVKATNKNNLHKQVDTLGGSTTI